MLDKVKKVMSASWSNGVLSALRAYKVCALPAAAALLLVVPYLSFSGVSGGWRVKPDAPKEVNTGLPEGEEVFDLKCLPESEGGGRNCLLNGPAPVWTKAGDALAVYGTVDDWKRAVSVQGLSMWRIMSALAVVAALWALLLSGYIIGHAPLSMPGGSLDRLGVALLPLGLCVCLFILLNNWLLAPPGGTMATASTFIVRQFLAHIDSQLEGGRVVYYELQLLYVGYVAALYLLCASGATLAPYAPSRAEPAATADVDGRAERLSMQMRHLRLILYVGALMLALTALRGKTNFDWSLEYLPPLWSLAEHKPELQAATAFYAKFHGLALNNITAVGVLNTLLLTALYVPAALVLQKRAAELALDAERAEKAAADAKAAAAAAAATRRRSRDADSDARVEPEKKKGFDRDEWLKAHGLAFPLKEQLARVAALLSPLLAGPVSELLSLLKG